MGLTLPFLLPLLASVARAEPVEARAAAAQDQVEDTHLRPELAAPGHGLRFIGLVQFKGNLSNVVSTNPFLDGQVVGPLGGTNGMTTGEDPGAWTEQRVGAFFTYAPPILDEQVALAAGFEVDWAFGDVSYGTGGNRGGGFGGDSVNLQTRRLHMTVAPTPSEQHTLRLHAGLQFLSDSVNDPSAARPDDLFRSGGRLMFFGSEAAGVSAFGRLHTDWGDRLRYRVGGYTLLEQGLTQADDVWLLMADAQLHPAYATTVGLHAWMLRDRSNGTGGVLGVGPTSALSEWQGGPRLDLRDQPEDDAPDASADLVWLGVDAGWNHDLSRGPLGATGLVVGNIGEVFGRGAGSRPVRGLLADMELRARYAPGAGSVVRLEGVFSSADDPDTPTYEGVFTGNSYGVVGATQLTHGCLLLFPDRMGINRHVAAVYDASAAGRGLAALTGSVGYDLVPNRLTASLGGGHAVSPGQGAYGSELNLGLVGAPFLFLDVGLRAAVLINGEQPFPGAEQVLPTNPWAVYASVDWLLF